MHLCVFAGLLNIGLHAPFEIAYKQEQVIVKEGKTEAIEASNVKVKTAITPSPTLQK